MYTYNMESLLNINEAGKYSSKCRMIYSEFHKLWIDIEELRIFIVSTQAINKQFFQTKAKANQS